MTMELRCPDCASPEVAPDPDGSADDRLCENCGARFLRASCLVTVVDAESAAALQICAAGSAPRPQFRFEIEKARAHLLDSDGDLWPVNAYSDAAEIHSLISTALDVDVIARADPRAALYLYPMALSDPDPLVAVDPGDHPTVLGHSLRLRESEGEDPVEFTLRLLEEIVAEANQLLNSLDSCRGAELE
jgi:hypothetical protein